MVQRLLQDIALDRQSEARTERERGNEYRAEDRGRQAEAETL